MGKPKKHTDAGASDKKRKAQDEPENTHGYEKHAPEDVKQPLWWPKGEKCAKTGLLTPMGHECGNCLYTRKRYYPTGTAQATVNGMIEAGGEASERHERLRQDNASGECKYVKTEAANTKVKSVIQSEQFSEGFEEGHAIELKSFARERNLSFPTEQMLVDYITGSLGMEVEMGKKGVLVVNVPDMPHGAQYKYRKGVKDSAKKIVEEKHGVLWNRKFKSRDYENAPTKLAARATKVAAIADDAEAAETAEKLFKLSVGLTTQKKAIEASRQNPQDYVEKLDSLPCDFIDIFGKCSETVRVNMLSATSFTLLGLGGDGCEVMALKVAKLMEVKGMFSAGALKASGCDDRFVSSCQQNLVQGFIDKVVKKRREDFVKIMSCCSAVIGKVNLAELDLDNTMIDETAGWNSQCTADLYALEYFGRVLAQDADDRLPRDLRIEGVALRSRVSKLSARLRCLTRVSGGSSSMAKIAWEMIPDIGTGDSCRRLDTEVVDEDTDSQQAVECTFGLLQEIAGSESVKTFANFLDGIGDENDSEIEQLINLRDDLVKNLFSGQTLITLYSGGLQQLASTIYCDGIGNGGAIKEALEQMDSDADIFRVLASVASTLMMFELSSVYRAIVKETNDRRLLAVKVNETMVMSAKKCDESILTHWSEIWEAEASIKSAARVTDDKQISSFQLICDVLSALSAENLIISVVKAIVGSPGCQLVTQNFIAVVSELVGSLPAQVKVLVDSAKAFKTIRQGAEQLIAGKSIGCMQSTAALTLIQSLVEPVSAMAEIPGWKRALKEEWATAFQGVAGQLDIIQVEGFSKKYRDEEKVIGLVDAWSFDANMWLASSTRDDKRTAEFKLTESYTIGLPPAARVIEELSKVVGSLQWLSAVESALLRALIEKLPEIKILIREAAVLMATMMLANSLLTKKAVPTTNKYAADKLSVSVADLPNSLQVKLNDFEAGLEEGNGGPHAGPDSTTGSPTAESKSTEVASADKSSKPSKPLLKLKIAPVSA
ncbi:unnamed protein product, partial [Prorocentrum cordatum]